MYLILFFILDQKTQENSLDQKLFEIFTGRSYILDSHQFITKMIYSFILYCFWSSGEDIDYGVELQI